MVGEKVKNIQVTKIRGENKEPLNTLTKQLKHEPINTCVEILAFFEVEELEQFGVYSRFVHGTLIIQSVTCGSFQINLVSESCSKLTEVV
jgi:hypothetical protein